MGGLHSGDYISWICILRVYTLMVYILSVALWGLECQATDFGLAPQSLGVHALRVYTLRATF